MKTKNIWQEYIKDIYHAKLFLIILSVHKCKSSLFSNFLLLALSRHSTIYDLPSRPLKLKCDPLEHGNFSTTNLWWHIYGQKRKENYCPVNFEVWFKP